MGGYGEMVAMKAPSLSSFCWNIMILNYLWDLF